MSAANLLSEHTTEKSEWDGMHSFIFVFVP